MAEKPLGFDQGPLGVRVGLGFACPIVSEVKPGWDGRRMEYWVEKFTGTGTLTFIATLHR